MTTISDVSCRWILSYTRVFIVYPSMHSWGHEESNKRQFVEGDISTCTSLKLAPSWAKNELALTLKPLELFQSKLPQNAFQTWMTSALRWKTADGSDKGHHWLPA